MPLLFENPSVASFTALALYVTLSVVSRVESYLFTTDMEFWREVVKAEIPVGELLSRACRCWRYSVSFLLTGLVVFERKDVLS
jgi:hypothetical protein